MFLQKKNQHIEHQNKLPTKQKWILTQHSLSITFESYVYCSLLSIWHKSILTQEKRHVICISIHVKSNIQYIPRNMHTVFALLCFVVVIHWLILPYPSGLLHWHCGNLTIAPVPAKQPWWIWINTSCEFIMNDCITTTKQSTTKPCAYFLGYTVLIQQRPRACLLFLHQK